MEKASLKHSWREAAGLSINTKQSQWIGRFMKNETNFLFLYRGRINSFLIMLSVYNYALYNFNPDYFGEFFLIRLRSQKFLQRIPHHQT